MGSLCKKKLIKFIIAVSTCKYPIAHDEDER